MEKQTNEEIKRVAFEVTCEAEQININNSKPSHFCSPRKYHTEKDKFVIKIMTLNFTNKDKKNYYLCTPDSSDDELTKKNIIS